MRDYKQFFAICKKHGFDYKDKVAEFTEGRTDSLKALTDGEYKEMMIRLSRFNAPPPGDAQRKKIIGIAHDMRWDVQGKEVMMKLIDEFMLTRTKYKKKLNDLTVDELNKICYTFETEVKSSFLKGLNK